MIMLKDKSKDIHSICVKILYLMGRSTCVRICGHTYVLGNSALNIFI